MRGLKTLLLAGVIVGIPAVASAQWYVGADAGINFGKDSKMSVTDGVDTVSGKATRDVGFTGLIQGGYAFGGSSVGTPKVELEGGYRYVSFNGGKLSDGSRYRSHDSANVATIMLNGIYEFMPSSNWHPFLGVGVGTAYIDYDKSLNEWKFAYQGMVGVSYDFNKNLSAKLQYRYLGTAGKVKSTSDGISSSVKQFDDHSVLVGWTYKFNKPAPAPVAAAAPVAAPAPAPMAKTFEVFFDFDKYNITPAGQKVIDQAVASAKAGNATRIDLTGHTDTVGSDKYNLALSLKRANAVKAVMVKEGIAADIISAKGVGKAGLLVPTPDGVREAQNRRVEILIP